MRRGQPNYRVSKRKPIAHWLEIGSFFTPYTNWIDLIVSAEGNPVNWKKYKFINIYSITINSMIFTKSCNNLRNLFRKKMSVSPILSIETRNQSDIHILLINSLWFFVWIKWQCLEVDCFRMLSSSTKVKHYISLMELQYGSIENKRIYIINNE